MIQSITGFLRKTVAFFMPQSTRAKVFRIGGLMLVLVILVILVTGDDTTTDVAEPSLPSVTLATVGNFGSESTFSVVGTVRAISEARLQAEAGGRITTVNTKIGDRVTAGSILGSIENGSERAQLLQAEAGYESALASAAVSEISVGDAESALLSAENSAVTTYRNAYISVHDITLDTVDVFFGNPESPTPGVRISSEGKSDYLNTSRYAFGKTLILWQKESTSLTTSSDLDDALRDAEERTKDLISILDALVYAVGKAENNDSLKDKLVSEYMPGLNSARTSLNGTLSALANAKTALTNARENVRRAQIGGTENPTASLANAQVKQALGGLRSAQVNYEKTLVRTPISGIVNALNITQGEYISIGAQTAIVANNGQIAPAIDPTTGKSEVKISVDESLSLKNGSTVSVVFSESTKKESTVIVVPLKAIKMLASGSVVFGVSDTNTLEAYPVILGAILGDSVEVTEGITRESRIITDARGRKEGDLVSVTK
ncbi:HlyD family efflux transporter periplasmic adaptor subunit [Candidatus Kaiserbacteria bacterium]|nr:MAG: HlyD family efflux transporter periplasmic adaptor subunit [Candidatus Kaiserbacteria bacterium]